MEHLLPFLQVRSGSVQ